MMLYPPMADLVNKVGSRYALVNLVAKRARDISAAAERTGEPLAKKAVSAAIDEVYTGKLTINTDPDRKAAPPMEPLLMEFEIDDGNFGAAGAEAEAGESAGTEEEPSAEEPAEAGDGE